MAEKVVFDILHIEKVLPHRYPFLMIDKIVEFDDNERLVAIKNVTANEPFFMGHFPGNPVMPGVMILECMAQAGAFLAKQSSEGVKPERTMYLVAANDVKFKKMVRPGDSLKIEVKFTRGRRPMWIIECTATVDGEMAAVGTVTAVDAD